MDSLLKNLLLSFFYLLSITANGQTPDTLLARQYFEKALSAQDSAQYDRSSAYFEKAADIYHAAALWEKKLSCKNGICGNLWQTHQLDKAQTLALDIVEEAHSRLDQKTPEEAKAYNSLAIVHAMRRDTEHALSYIDKALAIQLALTGELDTGTAAYYSTKGNIFLVKGDLEKALTFLTNSIEIRRILIGENTPQMVDSYNSIGLIYRRKGHDMQALDYYLKALTITETLRGSQADRKSTLYNNIGHAYIRKGAFEKAEEYLHKALDLQKKIYSEDHPNVAATLHNIGLSSHQKKDYDTALDYFQEALKIRKNVFRQPHPLVADSYNNIGVSYQNKGDYDNALKFHHQALDIRASLKKGSKAGLAETYNNIGIVHFLQGTYEESMEFLSNALSIRIAVFGTRHPLVVRSYNNIGKLLNAQEAFDKAIDYAQKAMNATFTESNTDDPDFTDVDLSKTLDPGELLVSLQIKAKAHYKLYQKHHSEESLKMAYEHYRQCDRIIEKVRQSHVSHEDKLTFNASVLEIYLEAQQCSHRLYETTNNVEFSDAAFYFAEKGKSNLLLHAVSDSYARQFGEIPDSLLRQEEDLKIDIAHFEYQVKHFRERNDSILLATYRDQYLFRAKRDLEQLVQSMESDYPKYYDIKYNNQVANPANVQKLLNDNSLFVEYVIDRQEYIAAPDQRNPQLYIYIIDQDGLRFKHLAWDKRSDKHITDLHKLLTRPSIVKSRNKSRFIETSYQLYRQLIHPLEKELTGKEKIIFVGADQLHYLPFEVLLRNNDNKPFSQLDYLVRDFEISYHYSASLFVESGRKDGQNLNQNLLAFAPVFDEPDKEGSASETTRYWAPDSTFQGLRSGIFQPLPGSEQEVMAIYDLFQSEKAGKHALLLRREANEEALKDKSEGPYRFIHIASHSFANAHQPRFSGIACTQRPLDTDSGEDGVLYAGEIYNLNLQADLVVLSSCESGLGKLVKGEGMLGLNRGFLYAGAPNIVYTLWKVNDERSSALMVNFYRNILQGKSYAASLRESKLALLKDEKNALPVYWSAFLLMGR